MLSLISSIIRHRYVFWLLEEIMIFFALLIRVRTRRGDVMVNLKRAEMRFIDEVFGMGSGYVLDFSNRTFAEFFEDEFSINIYQEKYETRGSSKASHLRTFIEVEDGFLVGKVLRRLWQVREEKYVRADTARACRRQCRRGFST